MKLGCHEVWGIIIRVGSSMRKSTFCVFITKLSVLVITYLHISIDIYKQKFLLPLFFWTSAIWISYSCSKTTFLALIYYRYYFCRLSSYFVYLEDP